MSNPPKVFISYSHDSAAHAARVLDFADALRTDGVDAIIDQYDPNPAEGWPRWMDRNVREADFILMVCTETYLRRVENREPAGVGLGVQWEGSLIYNLIYNKPLSGARYVPIIFGDSDKAYIPTPVQGHTFYKIAAFDFSDGLYEALIRHLTGQHATPAPPIGTPPVLPPKPRGTGANPP